MTTLVPWRRSPSFVAVTSAIGFTPRLSDGAAEWVGPAAEAAARNAPPEGHDLADDHRAPHCPGPVQEADSRS
ncbi:hypothetical protein GCM10018963_64450 [Saccharothrix longispora]